MSVSVSVSVYVSVSVSVSVYVPVCRCGCRCTDLYNLHLRIDYCGFGPFCSTPTNLLLFILLLKVLVCIMIISIQRQIIRLSHNNIMRKPYYLSYKLQKYG